MTGAPEVGDMPLDLSGIAALLDVHERTPSKWRDRGVLPEPDGRLGRTDWWWPCGGTATGRLRRDGAGMRGYAAGRDLGGNMPDFDRLLIVCQRLVDALDAALVEWTLAREKAAQEALNAAAALGVTPTDASTEHPHELIECGECSGTGVRDSFLEGCDACHSTGYVCRICGEPKELP